VKLSNFWLLADHPGKQRQTIQGSNGVPALPAWTAAQSQPRVSRAAASMCAPSRPALRAAQLAAPGDRGRQGASAHEVHGPVPQQAVGAAAEDQHHGFAGRGQVHRQLAQESARGSSPQRVLVRLGGAFSEGTWPMVGSSAAERVWRYCESAGRV
jgi:hypothetical protein